MTRKVDALQFHGDPELDSLDEFFAAEASPPKPPLPAGHLLTTREAATELGLAYVTFTKYVQKGKVKPYRTVGRSHLWRIKDLAPLRERNKPGRPRVDR